MITNGGFFPVVTIQTSVGRFSSFGGWNGITPASTNGLLQINVQAPPVLVSTISITNPVDLKWTASSNLYVLSGSTATITEYDTNGTVIASLSGIGSNPSGLDVDAAGNVYVAMTGSNQVWRFYPTNATFAADPSFGSNGYGFIGLTNGSTGTNAGEFNAPYDVAISPDGGTISISDSGNNQIQQFDTNGNFISAFGGLGTNMGQFNTPEGLAYDSIGTLYIVDAGNNRVVQSDSTIVVGMTGTSGTNVGQFQNPVNISANERGIYVADTGNNRILAYNWPHPNSSPFSATSSIISPIRFALATNFSGPYSIAAVEDFLVENFYVADTGNNRVVLFQLPQDNPTSSWTNMTARITAGDIAGAASYFSAESTDRYQQAFLSIGSSNLISIMNQIGTLTPDYVQSDFAEYYFQQTIAGQMITFSVKFVRENGVWKILEF